MKFPLVLTVLFLLLPSISRGEQLPNILFLFADDLSYEALGYAGKNTAQTPRLDSLREQGCSFSHTFNPGSWTPAVCVASRTMLETGYPVWRASRYKPKESSKELLWSRLMKQAGYETYFTGKWHINGLNPKDLFDHVGTVRPGMPSSSNDAYTREFISGKKDKWSPDDPSYGGYWQGGTHWSEATASEACAFLESAKKNTKPFFMYISFNAPHDPRQSSKQYLNKYNVTDIQVPKSFLSEYPYKDEIGCPKTLRDERLAPFPRTLLSIQKNRQEYYSIISHLDEQIGRILDTLKDIEGPTYIIFTADQGLSIGDHGLMGKQNLYDPSIRVPLIIAGPRVTPASTVNTPVYMQSIMPTCLELARLPKQKHIFFSSLVPFFDKNSKIKSEDIYGAMFDRQRMIRTEKWKMLLYPKAKIVRLYNMEKDPEEIHDLASEPQYISVMEDLLTRLKKLQKEQNDSLSISETFQAFFANPSS